MNQKEVEISKKHFRTDYDQLGMQEKHVAHHLAPQVMHTFASDEV